MTHNVLLKVLNSDLFSTVEQWFTSEKDKKINKGEKIGEKGESDMSKCCERCFSVAPLTNAGFFWNKRCVCFKVTGKGSPMPIKQRNFVEKKLQKPVCFEATCKFRPFLMSWS